MNKQTLRTQLRQKRRSLDAATHQQRSLEIAKKITAAPYFQQSQNIACYLVNDGEVDTHTIIENIWHLGKNCFLPVINIHSKSLTFALYTKDCRLCENHYGILEPSDTEILTVEQLDLIIAPLVGFDHHNNRLGMGGGFYDRTFANCQTKKPLFVGLAFSFQQLESLPNEHHDAKLDFVVTD